MPSMRFSVEIRYAMPAEEVLKGRTLVAYWTGADDEGWEDDVPFKSLFFTSYDGSLTLSGSLMSETYSGALGEAMKMGRVVVERACGHPPGWPIDVRVMNLDLQFEVLRDSDEAGSATPPDRGSA